MLKKYSMKKNLSSLLLTVSLIGFGQVYSSGFEPTSGPLSNWTLYNQDAKTPNTNVNFVNAAWVSSYEEFDNSVAISTSWYTPAGASNDWMVTPAITLPSGTNTLYWHAKAYDPDYPDSYRVLISTTGNAVANFTTTLLTVGNGSTTGEASTWQNKSLDLSAYAGQTIYLAFQNFSTDKFLLGIDNVYVVNGTVSPPNRVMTTSNISKTGGSINWTAPASGVTGYDYSFGSVGHNPTVTNSTTGTTATIGSLTENTRYQYYVRGKNGTMNSLWIGPYSLFTAQQVGLGATSYGFDNPEGYLVDGWNGAWGVNSQAGNPQAGTQMVFSNNSSSAATNRWLLSKPYYMTVGNNYTITFFLRSFGNTTMPQSIKFTVGNAATTASQTNTLWTSTTFASGTWTQQTVTFSPTVDGTYYFGFNHFSPTQLADVSLGLDSFNINGVLGVNDIEAKKKEISIYPNPAKDFITIKSDSKVNNIEIFDASGRKVQTILKDNKIDVRNLSSGNYIINVETKDGVSTEKFIKK